MTRETFHLVMLVSSAHALCHIFELALPSVEQMICVEYDVTRTATGWLGTVFRVPFGLMAVLAGYLADRYGSKRLLLVYLLGCGLCAAVIGFVGQLATLFVAMFALGAFASIYHPAGLACIAHATDSQTRGAALGWHGIVGSIGIASAPFIAGSVFQFPHVEWREYYVLLAVVGLLLAVTLALRLPRERVENTEITSLSPGASARNPEPGSNPSGVTEGEAQASSRQVPRRSNDDALDEHGAHWRSYLLLVSTGAMFGFIYAAFMQFLPRYLSEETALTGVLSPETLRNYTASFVLLFAIAGQAVSGRLARPHRLVRMLRGILLANAPILVWVAVAHGTQRVLAASTLAFVHFMSQPVYNSLIPRYIPRRRRSLGYGFSNMVCFGIGSLGAAYAGEMPSDLIIYGGLAVVALTAFSVALTLPSDLPEVPEASNSETHNRLSQS